MIRKLSSFIIMAGVGMGILGWQTPAAAQSAEEEVAKQTARLISDAISKRVGDDVDDIYAAPGSTGMTTESADLLNTVWGTLTYNRVDFDGSFAGGGGGVDVFLATVGFDHRFGNFIPGVSVTGAIADVDDLTGSSGTATISPYLGYVITDYFFVNALVGLSLGSSDVGGLDSDSVGVFTEEDANFVWRSGNWLATAKAGHRYRFTETDPEGFSSSDSTAHTILGGGKVGYKLDTVRPYVGAQYEYNFNQDAEDADFVYLLLGFAMDVSDDFNMDLSGQAEVLDEASTSYQVAWQGRFRF